MRPLWERNMGMCRGLPVVLILDCWGGEQLRAFENVAQEDHALKNFFLILLRLWAVGISFMEKFARNGYAHISSFVNKGCNNLRFCVVQQERRAQSVPQQAQRLRLVTIPNRKYPANIYNLLIFNMSHILDKDEDCTGQICSVKM